MTSKVQYKKLIKVCLKYSDNLWSKKSPLLEDSTAIKINSELIPMELFDQNFTVDESWAGELGRKSSNIQTTKRAGSRNLITTPAATAEWHPLATSYDLLDGQLSYFDQKKTHSFSLVKIGKLCVCNEIVFHLRGSL